MYEQLWTAPILFLVGAVAGLVDSIAGGGGLITLPTLLALGLPPQTALGTNKFQSSFGSVTASLYHIRKGVINLRDAMPGIVCTFAGAAAGAWTVELIASDLLARVIPILLLAIALYGLFTPRFGSGQHTPVMARLPFYLIAGLGLGFYDGFFGPGVGSFWALAFVMGVGFDLTRATAYTKLMNCTSNIASLIVFFLGGRVVWLAGAAMAIGQIAGSRLGSALVLKKGANLIRPVYITVVLLIMVKLIYDRW